MKNGNYILRTLVTILFLLFIGGAAKADGVDPKIGLGPTGSQNTFSQTDCHSFDDESSSCSFTSDGIHDVVIDIVNNTEGFIVEDTVTPSAFSGPLSCTADPETAPGWSGQVSTDGQSCIFGGGFISPGFEYGLTLGFLPQAHIPWILRKLPPLPSLLRNPER